MVCLELDHKGLPFCMKTIVWFKVWVMDWTGNLDQLTLLQKKINKKFKQDFKRIVDWAAKLINSHRSLTYNSMGKIRWKQFADYWVLCKVLDRDPNQRDLNMNRIKPLPIRNQPWRLIHFALHSYQAPSLSYTLCICSSPCSEGTFRGSHPTQLNIRRWNKKVWIISDSGNLQH